jgi:hypothetical protein
MRNTFEGESKEERAESEKIFPLLVSRRYYRSPRTRTLKEKPSISFDPLQLVPS